MRHEDVLGCGTEGVVPEQGFCRYTQRQLSRKLLEHWGWDEAMDMFGSQCCGSYGIRLEYHGTAGQ
jgi:hypothetical protein